jgi:hypothetical protein
MDTQALRQALVESTIWNELVAGASPERCWLGGAYLGQEIIGILEVL